MVLSVRMRIQWGIGRFCRIFLASFFLIMNVLWDGYNRETIFNREMKKKRTRLARIEIEKLQRSRGRKRRNLPSLIRSAGRWGWGRRRNPRGGANPRRDTGEDDTFYMDIRPGWVQPLVEPTRDEESV